jgi:hypothetical protein
VLKLSDAEPDMPVEDRAADTWEPLVAVADHVGGSWPQRARRACLVLTAAADEADEEGSLNTRLLSDVRDIFTERSASFMASPDLVDALKRRTESPWDDFDFNARKLAYRLKDFGVKPGFNTSGTARGYRLEHLHDAFARYLRQEASDTVNAGSDLHKGSDGSNPSDASIRQTPNMRQTEPAGQPGKGRVLTLSDDPPAETESDCGHQSKRAPNGRCIQCITENWNDLTREATA